MSCPKIVRTHFFSDAPGTSSHGQYDRFTQLIYGCGNRGAGKENLILFLLQPPVRYCLETGVYVQCCAAACAAAMQLRVWPEPEQRKYALSEV